MSLEGVLGVDISSGKMGRLLWAAVGGFWLALMGLPSASMAASKASSQFRKEADALFTNGNLLRLVLEIPESGMKSLRSAPRTYVPAVLHDGNTTYSNLAVHLKGAAGSFRRVDDQPGLTVNFNYLEPDSPRFHGLKKIHLNNSVQDPSRLSELVAGQMFREAGVPAARAAPVLVELNGRKLGLYVIMESMNKDFLAQYFKNAKGNLYGQSRRGDITDNLERMEGDAPLTREDLAALGAAVREENPKLRLERMEKTLDLDRFLTFMALEAILGHWDGYTIACHNYRLYQDVDTGRMVFFPHDLDQLMVRQNVGLMPRANGLVAQGVLNTPELRARYQQRVCSLATNLFMGPRWPARVEQAVSTLLPALESYDADIARAFTNAATNFKGRFISRGRQLERQIAILSGTSKPLAFSNNVARLKEWQGESWQNATRLERIKTDDGRQTLWISTPSPTMASWRTQVLLEPGRYRFEGMAGCSGVEATFRKRGNGAGLTAPNYRRTSSLMLSGDAPWQKLTCEFEVTAAEDVELACELGASKGQVWFDEATLQLVRLSKP
jgi:spore coat protein H